MSAEDELKFLQEKAKQFEKEAAQLQSMAAHIKRQIKKMKRSSNYHELKSAEAQTVDEKQAG